MVRDAVVVVISAGVRYGETCSADRIGTAHNFDRVKPEMVAMARFRFFFEKWLVGLWVMGLSVNTSEDSPAMHYF